MVAVSQLSCSSRIRCKRSCVVGHQSCRLQLVSPFIRSHLKTHSVCHVRFFKFNLIYLYMYLFVLQTGLFCQPATPVLTNSPGTLSIKLCYWAGGWFKKQWTNTLDVVSNRSEFNPFFALRQSTEYFSFFLVANSYDSWCSFEITSKPTTTTRDLQFCHYFEKP